MEPEPQDPVAQRSALLAQVFPRYLRLYLRRNFHALRISRAGLPRTEPGRPVIVCANHPSWWDPAVFIILMPTLFPGRIGFGPMDAEALGRYGLFRRLGIFGIDLASRAGAVRFLRTGADVLANPRHVLWITAEGHFTDPRRRPVCLRPGIAHLMRRVPDAVVLPLALEYAFWNERFPEALVRFGPPIEPASGSVADCTARLARGLEETMDALALESMTRDPARFRRLAGGRVGVGGVYDLYRRAAAMATGRRFDPSHEGLEP